MWTCDALRVFSRRYIIFSSKTQGGTSSTLQSVAMALMRAFCMGVFSLEQSSVVNWRDVFVAGVLLDSSTGEVH